MTMGAQHAASPATRARAVRQPGSAVASHIDVPRLPGNPDDSRSGTSYKMQRSLIGMTGRLVGVAQERVAHQIDCSARFNLL
jgi:hypothetical protein